MLLNQRRNSSVLGLALVSAFSLGAMACGDDGGGGDNGGGGDTDFAASPKAVVKFKGDTRLQNDLSSILQLDAKDVCAEFGQYSCTETVHKITLGGVAPYELGFYKAIAESTVTAPLATERVALHACRERIDRDIADPANAVLLQGVSLDGAGLDVNSSEVEGAIDLLYKKAVQRPATAAEIGHLQSLYTDVEADSDAPARDWAILSCFSVFTSLEFLFY